jgi:hypothetical protein
LSQQRDDAPICALQKCQIFALSGAHNPPVEMHACSQRRRQINKVRMLP